MLHVPCSAKALESEEGQATAKEYTDGMVAMAMLYFGYRRWICRLQNDVQIIFRLGCNISFVFSSYSQKCISPLCYDTNQ